MARLAAASRRGGTGAGVIGSVYGGKLLQSGREVVMPARGGRLAELRDQGLILEDAELGQRTVHPAGVPGFADQRECRDSFKSPDLYQWMPEWFAIRYWRKPMAGPRGELWFAAHGRVASDEMYSLAVQLQHTMSTIGRPAPALDTLLAGRVAPEGFTVLGGRDAHPAHRGRSGRGRRLGEAASGRSCQRSLRARLSRSRSARRSVGLPRSGPSALSPRCLRHPLP